METQSIVLDRQHARDLYRAYRKHLHYSQPIDREIMRAYQLIAQGRLVIKALESVVVAGLDPHGLPKLAICRADATSCDCSVNIDGSVRMSADRWNGNHLSTTLYVQFGRDTFSRARGWKNGRAFLPSIPLHLRPRRALANYHILWEAEWTKVPPRDPLLLRRIGKADLWLVLAQWDLTEVERAALAARIAN